MKIKMIVTDLDGTILRSDFTVSTRTKAVFERCRKNGIKTACATGRANPVNVVPVAMFDACITSNGAMVHVGKKIIYNRLISPAMSRTFLMACDMRGLNAASQLNGIHYSNFTVTDVWPYILDYKQVDFSTHNKYAEKCYALFHNAEDIDFVKPYLHDDLYMSVSRDGMMMVMHKEAAKAKAIEALALHWGIGQKEIAAFGDDLNDLDMISYAGAGVAMGNALGDVKAVADEVCLSNNEDGVADWIERNVLL